MINREYVKLLFMIDCPRKKNILDLARETGMSSNHMTIVMQQWEREGVITKERTGREFEIGLTEAGMEIVRLMRQIDEKCEKRTEFARRQDGRG